jgi:hypothetical protein
MVTADGVQVDTRCLVRQLRSSGGDGAEFVHTRVGWSATIGLLLLAALSGACGGDTETGRAVPPNAEEADVRGQAVAVSDVVGDPDSAITDGWVMAVPEEALEDLWEAPQREPPDPLDLPYWNPTLPATVAEETDAALVEVSSDGSFVLAIPAGSYLVCLLERDDPVVPFGCDHADLDPGTPFRLTAGEAGIRVE